MRARVEEIVSSTKGRLVKGDAAREVHGVSTDTRSIAPEQLFVALEGPNFDGNEFTRWQHGLMNLAYRSCRNGSSVK